MITEHDKRVARLATKRALRQGVIVPRSVCEGCGSSDEIHCHHNNYSDPLDVSWLCRRCHRAAHGKFSRAEVVWIREFVGWGRRTIAAAAVLLGADHQLLRNVLNGTTYKTIRHPHIMEQRDELLAFVRRLANGAGLNRADAAALVAKHEPPYTIDAVTGKPLPPIRKRGRPKKARK